MTSSRVEIRGRLEGGKSKAVEGSGMTGTGREMERDFSDGGGIGEEEGCDGGRGEIRIEERVEIERKESGGRWWQWKMGGEGDGGAAIWRRRRRGGSTLVTREQGKGRRRSRRRAQRRRWRRRRQRLVSFLDLP